MTESGLDGKPWKAEHITRTTPSSSLAPPQMQFQDSFESDIFCKPQGARSEPPQRWAATPIRPNSRPGSRYPLGMPTPSPSPSRVVDKEGRVISPSSFEIVANTAGVGSTTIEPILEPPVGLSNCIVGPLWAFFISEILSNRGSLSTDQVRSEISKHFPTRYDLSTSKDDPYGWQVRFSSLETKFARFPNDLSVPSVTSMAGTEVVLSLRPLQ
jgi:hypothetical protein